MTQLWRGGMRASSQPQYPMLHSQVRWEQPTLGMAVACRRPRLLCNTESRAPCWAEVGACARWRLLWGLPQTQSPWFAATRTILRPHHTPSLPLPAVGPRDQAQLSHSPMLTRAESHLNLYTGRASQFIHHRLFVGRAASSIQACTLEWEPFKHLT